MPKDLTYEKPTLVQVMAWGCQEQAIAWAAVDQGLWRHMAPLGHNELILFFTIVLQMSLSHNTAIILFIFTIEKPFLLR